MVFHKLKSCLKGVIILLVMISLFACNSPLASNHPNLVVRTRPHKLSINSVSWSSDGKWIASGSQDTTVRILDIATQRITAEITNFRGNVASITWSPNSKHLAVGSNEPTNTLRIWDLASENTRFMADPGPDQTVTSLSWSPDGKSIAVGMALSSQQTGASPGGSIVIYDANSGSPTNVLTNTESISTVAWSQSGQFIAAGYSGEAPRAPTETIRVWSAKDWRAFASFEHSELVYNMSWSRQSDLLASSGYDGTIAVWDVTTKQNTSILSGHSSIASAVAWSPSGRFLASGSWDGSLIVWDVSNKTIKHTFQNPDYVNSIAWSPTDDLLVAGCHNGELLIWSVK